MAGGARVRVTINQAELRRLTHSQSSELLRAINRIGRRVVNQAKRNAPVDDGQGRQSISHTVTVEGTRITMRAGSPLKYMYWQHEGTGIYGPHKTPIVPVHRKFLRFEVKSGKLAKGTRPVIFAKSVRGVPPNPWLVKAFREVSPFPVRER